LGEDERIVYRRHETDSGGKRVKKLQTRAGREGSRRNKKNSIKFLTRAVGKGEATITDGSGKAKKKEGGKLESGAGRGETREKTSEEERKTCLFMIAKAGRLERTLKQHTNGRRMRRWISKKRKGIGGKENYGNGLSKKGAQTLLQVKDFFVTQNGPRAGWLPRKKKGKKCYERRRGATRGKKIIDTTKKRLTIARA